MRQRHYRARVWLNENEYKHFVKNVEETGLSKETYLRQLILGYAPKVKPSSSYYEIINITYKIIDIADIITNSNPSKSKSLTEILNKQRIILLEALSKLSNGVELP